VPAGDPAEFEAWLAGLPRDEYLDTHRVRYRETWARIGPLLLGAEGRRRARRVLEIGSPSPLSGFLAARAGAETSAVTTDLRQAWPVPEASADAVLSVEVLEHLNDRTGPEASIGEIATFCFSGARRMFVESFRILVPGGALVVTTPNATGLDAIGNALRRRHPFLYPPHVREYAPRDVIALAEEAGFRTERWTTFFAWNAHPDIDRAALSAGLAALGFDMAERGDDALFVFRRPWPPPEVSSA
jgi:hypothetical protein